MFCERTNPMQAILKTAAFAAIITAALLLSSCGQDRQAEPNGDAQETYEQAWAGNIPAEYEADETSETEDEAPALSERDQAWVSDIEHFAWNMRRHPRLNGLLARMPTVYDYSGGSFRRTLSQVAFFEEERLLEFNERVDDLLARVPELTDDEILFELLGISALTACGHTGVDVPIRFFPIAMSWYADGLYAFSAPIQEPDALFARLVSINGIPYSEILDRLRRVIPHYNEYGFLSFHVHRFINNAKFLRHLGIVPYDLTARFVMVDVYGYELAFYLSADDFDWAEDTVSWQQVVDVALRNTRMDENYFYEFMPEYQALYVRYRSGSQEFGCPIKAEFFERVLYRIEEFGASRLVMDIRGLSGHIFQFAAFMDAVNANERLERVYVLTLPSSFSGGAIVASVLQEGIDRALVVGEPTGSNFNFAGSLYTWTMPNSGVNFYVSRAFLFSRWNLETGPVMPDVRIPFTIDDLRSNTDPLLDFALGRGRG